MYLSRGPEAVNNHLYIMLVGDPLKIIYFDIFTYRVVKKSLTAIEHNNIQYHKERQRGSPLLGANKYTHIYIKCICVYIGIIYLFETIVSKAWPSSSVFFKIINIIFHVVTISWILKVFRFALVS